MFASGVVSGMTPSSEQAALLALIGALNRGEEWYRTATMVDDARSARRVLDRDWNGFEPFDVEAAEALAGRVQNEDLDRYEDLIRSLETQGISLVTVLDDEYPANLREIYNRPPFLFVRGRMRTDERAVAIVGTRRASDRGRKVASELATELSRHDVTVLSGLALGIDGAAHTATLDAGGRTVAVLGTGILKVYPTEHAELAERIVKNGGALVSQFWPDAPPTRYSFPMRNVVMSGMAMGTVVVEASSTSGARMQARLALEHGKQLFLLEELVLQEEWARRYSERMATTVVRSVEDVLAVLDRLQRPIEQLTLS
ncbi:MAG: DNA-processing protein DprA [Actinomycetota bacterium]|nr:DNA-processing protein DprA [Actinomycetota bacterium]